MTPSDIGLTCNLVAALFFLQFGLVGWVLCKIHDCLSDIRWELKRYNDEVLDEELRDHNEWEAGR